MSNKPTPKRRPKRPSSQAIYEAILEAARQLLSEPDPQITTNHLAERAGVSVGSLYQYFPNKEAILLEVAGRYHRAHLERFVAGVQGATSFEAVIEVAARGFVGQSEEDRRLRRHLMLMLPLNWSSEQLRLLWATVIDHAVTVLKPHLPDADEAALRRQVIVIVHAVQGVLHGAELYHADEMDAEGLLDEVKRLAGTYLLSGEL